MVFVLTAFVNMARLITRPLKMSIPVLSVAGLMLACFTTNSSAQMALSALSKSEIKSLLFGRSVEGEYDDGLSWSEHFYTNGTSDYTQSGLTLHGTMTLNGNVLCFFYRESNTGGCFEIWRHGPNCFSFYDASSSATLNQRRFGRGWDARAWYQGQEATCAGDQLS